MASKAVNRPMDQKQKETDVNNKLQLYGIYAAFQNGKVPSNKQIDIALNSLLASKPLAQPNQKLSAEGQKLVKDLNDVIEQAKLLVLTKNQGNLLQDFIWQCQHITGDEVSKPNVPVEKETAQQHAQEAKEGLRTLGTLLISNGQFRKLLSDATVLLRDVAGDAAQKAATRVQPSEDQLNQLDEPAEDDTWHDTPNVGEFRSNIQSKINQNKVFGKKQAEKAAGDAAEAAHPEGKRDPAEVADLTAQEKQSGQPTGVDAQQGATAGVNTLKQAASENIPDEQKEKARNKKAEYRDRTKDYLGTKMPKERREQTIWRLKKMVVEVQGHQDYQQAIETLLRLAEEYTGHTKQFTGQGASAVKGAHGDNSIQAAEADLKTLIERSANSTSTDDFFDSINQIYRDADNDPQLKNWFKKIDTYIRKCLKEQGFIMQDQATEEWNALYDEGNQLLRHKYRSHTDRILDEIKFVGKQFDEDPQNKAFGNAVQKLFLDLGRDESGIAAFKPHLLKDLQDVIIPGFFENVRYVPIPRIEYTGPDADAVIENLVIEGDNLAPNSVEFTSDNYFRWGRKGFSKKNKNKVMFSASGIQMDIRDVSFYVNKKQGFPSIKDTGICDIFAGGTGFGFKIEMENADKNNREHFFKINSVKVDAKNINIKIKKSNHKLLFSIAKGLLLKVMKPAIQKAIEKQIKDNIEKADAYAYGIYKEVEKGKEAAKRDPENAANIYQQYVNAVQTKMNEKKAKAEEVAKKTDVNVAITKEDSMFKHISLPGGISTKATEYRDLAAKGDRWESPVFGLGSAKESTDLPRAQTVTRKPHQTRSGGIRGGNHPNSSGSGNFSGSSGTGLGSSGTGIGSTGAGYGSSGTGYGSTGTGYGSSGTGLGQTTGTGLGGSSGIPQTSATSYPGTATGTSGLNAEIDQAFRSTGATSGTGTSGLAPSGTGATGQAGQTTFYDSATRQI